MISISERFKILNGGHLKKLDGSAHSHADIYLPESLQNLQFQVKNKQMTDFFIYHLQLTILHFFKKESHVALIFSVNFISTDVVTVVQQWSKLISLM